jgi:hypothetical protein
VPKLEKPVDRPPPFSLWVADPTRERQAELAYAAYAQRALLSFDVQGQIELIRQHRARMPLCDAIGDDAITEHVRGRFEHERTH